MTASVLAKRPRPLADNDVDDDDDIMLPMGRRRLPSYIAIENSTPIPEPSSDAGCSATQLEYMCYVSSRNDS